MPRTPWRRLAAAAVLLVPAGLLMTGQAASAAPAATTVAIASTLPRWLPKSMSSRTAATIPPAPASKKLSIRVYLAPNGGEAALKKAVAAVSDPTSPSYGQFLSTAAYRARYQPTQASVTQVSRWLTSQHLSVTGTEAQRRYVSATGTVSQLNKAFRISLHTFSHLGQKVVAPTTAARVPSGVASAVLTVSGLDTTEVKMKPASTPKYAPEGFRNARPCSTYFGQLKANVKADLRTPLPTYAGQTLTYASCGYTGPQLREAYTESSPLGGQGVTVAITDAYRWNLIAQDANTYAEAHGDGAYVAGQLTENLPSFYRYEKECGPAGWSGEETLDVEAVHALAPDANIRYYASSSCFDDDFLDTLGRVVDENVAKVVTNSWSDLEYAETIDTVVAYEQVFLQGAMQGITFTFSSGDDGDEVEANAIKQVDYPASDPYVTAVGGTSTGIDADGSRTFDAGWGTRLATLAADGKSWSSSTFLYGSGGGYSALFNRPSYQDSAVSPDAPAGRAVPDISMVGDPNTGFLVGQTQQFSTGLRYGEYRIGGTSLSSPLLAAMLALTIEKNGGRAFGAFNATLYANTAVATDVVPQPRQIGVVRPDLVDQTKPSGAVKYSVRTFGQDSSLEVTRGWDPVTGLGVPNLAFLGLEGSGTGPTAGSAETTSGSTVASGRVPVS